MVQYLTHQGEVNVCSEITLYEGRYIQSNTACFLNWNDSNSWSCGTSYVGSPSASTVLAVPNVLGGFVQYNPGTRESETDRVCTPGLPPSWKFTLNAVSTGTTGGVTGGAGQGSPEQPDDTTWEKIWAEEVAP
jgi:hypothetical protein